MSQQFLVSLKYLIMIRPFFYPINILVNLLKFLLSIKFHPNPTSKKCCSEHLCFSVFCVKSQYPCHVQPTCAVTQVQGTVRSTFPPTTLWSFLCVLQASRCAIPHPSTVAPQSPVQCTLPPVPPRWQQDFPAPPLPSVLRVPAPAVTVQDSPWAAPAPPAASAGPLPTALTRSAPPCPERGPPAQTPAPQAISAGRMCAESTSRSPIGRLSRSPPAVSTRPRPAPPSSATPGLATAPPCVCLRSQAPTHRLMPVPLIVSAPAVQARN